MFLSTQAICVVLVVLCADRSWSTPLRGIARGVQSELVLLQRNGNNNGQNSFQSNEAPQLSRSNKIPTGEALDLFYRYGFFSLSVRVVPRDDPGKWLIREPTAAIFQENSVTEKVSKGSNKFDSQFQIYLCDDVAELQQAYFRDFTADGVEEPHKLFTGSWHSSTKSKYLGLSKDIFESAESSYVLIKLPKTRTVRTVVDDGARGNRPQLKPEAQKTMDAIRVGDPDSVLEFVNNYGSHYVQEVVLGDMVYQVLALTPDQYKALKDTLRSPEGGRKTMSQNEFSSLYDSHLAPWLIKESGKVLAASGDLALLSFLQESLVVKGQFGSYPSLLELQRQPALNTELESLTSSSKSLAVIGLHFSALREWVADIQTREYYDEIVGTQTALWEVNIAKK